MTPQNVREIGTLIFFLPIRVLSVLDAYFDLFVAYINIGSLYFHDTIVVGEFDMFGEFDNREFLPHF